MTETLTIGQQKFNFGVFWLSSRHVRTAGVAVADLIVLVFDRELPAACWIAVMVAPMIEFNLMLEPRASSCAFCSPVQGRRALWFLPPAGDNFRAKVLALPEAEVGGVVRPAAVAQGRILNFRRRSAPDETSNVDGAFEVDWALCKLLYPAPGAAEPVWRAQARQRRDDSYAPAAQSSDIETTLHLKVTLPETSSVPLKLRTLPSRHDGEPPRSLRLDLSAPDRAGLAALDGVMVAFVNRQYMGGRTASWTTPVTADLGDLLTPQTWKRKPEASVRRFVTSYFGPGDLFFIFCRQGPCRIALVDPHAKVDPPLTIEDVLILALRFDGTLKHCDLEGLQQPEIEKSFGFPPLSKEAYLRLKIQIEGLRNTAAWTDAQEFERTNRRWLETRFANLRPRAGRGDRLERILPGVTAPLPFFFVAQSYADLIEHSPASASAARSDAAERLFDLLDPDQLDFLAQLCAPALPYAAPSVTRLDELARRRRPGDTGADILWRLFDLMVWEWKSNASASDPMGRRLDAAEAWYKAAGPEAQIAVLRWGVLQDRRRIAPRLVAYRLKPGLEDLDPAIDIEAELAFVGRHFEAGARSDAATRAALLWATDDLEASLERTESFEPIRDRLKPHRADNEQNPKDPSLLPLSKLREWRKRIDCDTIVDQLDTLRRWIRTEYEAGRSRLSFLPAVGLDMNLLGRHAQLKEQLDAEIRVPPHWTDYVQEAQRQRWKGAALAALVNFLKAMAAAAMFTLSRGPEGRGPGPAGGRLRLTREMTRQIQDNAGSLALAAGDTVETYATAVIPFLNYAPSDRDARLFVGLARRARTNVAAIERSLVDLRERIGWRRYDNDGVAVGGGDAARINAEGIVALDIKTWLTRFAAWVVARFDRSFDRLSEVLQDAAPSPASNTVAPAELQRLQAVYDRSIRPYLMDLRQARLSELLGQPADLSARLREAESLFGDLSRLEASVTRR